MKKFKVNCLKLKWYSPSQIESISVCEITVPKSLDRLGYPVTNGMNDLRMGPHSMEQKCKTCLMSFLNCPGHFGHINLPMAMINPMMKDFVILILNAACSNCGLFKIMEQEKISEYQSILSYKHKFDGIMDTLKDVENYLKDNYNEKNDNFDGSPTFAFLRKCSSKRKCPLCNTKSPRYKRISSSMKVVENETLRYVSVARIKELIDNLESKESSLLREMFSKGKKEFNEGERYRGLSDMIFLEKMLIIPNKFRLPSKLDDDVFEHAINTALNKILSLSIQLAMYCEGETKIEVNLDTLEAELQNEILNYFEGDSRGKSNMSHRAVLEKKEGLFRKNIMGKRVNYSARSVISPDPNLATDEIGVPLIFAMSLTFTESVTEQNQERLEEAVLNGSKVYPGANFLTYKGALINLGYISKEKRLSYVALFLNEPIIVHRHLINGDYCLVNRQPTLHSCSLMAHKAKILKNEKTIRMHYVNCKPYNADFDGDEMNIHVPQDLISRSEAMVIASVRNNYYVASSGNPIRGLTQDHIVGAAFLSFKDTLFTYEEYSKIVYDSLAVSLNYGKVKCINPAIISKDVRYYTGKQIITTILLNLNINLTVSIKGKLINSQSIFVNSYFVDGILDKNSLGPTTGSIPDACGKIYGMSICDTLLTVFGKMINSYLFFKGFSVRFDDLLINTEGDKIRRDILQNVKDSSKLATDIPKILKDGNNRSHLYKNLSVNNMYITIQAGAKGSLVNLSQISLSLGQQEIEGKKVPVTINDKTLPMFRRYEHNDNIAAGGYVAERFLTGLNPGAFYFHCMAGREGLVDTAVKTAHSGYLQRVLVKFLEGVRIEYDGTVRNFDKSIIQFYTDDMSYGKSVGIIAAQSIGEPSTQMTLNTFHLAGVAGRNVTLGIPRLREILMFATKEISTPRIVIKSDVDTFSEKFIKKFHVIYLYDCIDKVIVKNVVELNERSYCRNVTVEFLLNKPTESVIKKIKTIFVNLLRKHISKNGTTLSKTSKVKELSTTVINKDSQSSDEDSIDQDEINEEIAVEKELDQSFIEDDEEKELNLKNSVKVTDNRCVINLILPIDFNMLFKPVIEEITKKIIIKKTDGFTDGYLDDNQMILSGNNFYGFFLLLDKFKYDQALFYNCTFSNDIYSVYKYFGVEACRQTIVNEIKNVFNVYGISIQQVHLDLIADFMTRNGTFSAFHRKEFNFESILQMMSFESCYSNLKSSAMFRMKDEIESPSANLTVGNLIKNGTGFTNILYDLSSKFE